jgi:uncharacterized protein YjdB
MKVSFIAAGGVLLAAAAMATTMVGTAVADDDKRNHPASMCVLDAQQDATWLRIDHHSVTAGTRDASACKGRVIYKDDNDKKDSYKDDYRRDKDDKDDDHGHYDWQKPGWWGLDGIGG